ncbi:MAG TPA: hypothetical protein VFA79_16275 [Myxococcales bacterium]|nr:hypothetical protein [Myxococcales bacterium]
MEERAALEQELAQLAPAARERRSADLFLRAAIETFCCVVITGVCVKLFHDSKRTPLFLWPLLLLDALLVWDVIRGYREGRASLRRELRREARIRELRSTLGIDG